MKTFVQQVEQWYAVHAEELAAHWACRLLVSEAEDVAQGKVALECESQAQAATITLWHKGDVEVIRLDSPTNGKDPIVVDDRRLSPSEDVASLIDSYVKMLSTPSKQK
jgi:hypothetical protein